jgi:XTP/dITP diphosphohydrolase
VKLYCATTNPGKLREFRLAIERFGGVAFEVESLPGLSDLPPCEENGSSFEENAVAKALYYSRHSPGLLFADDSGLAVDALGGAPGVLSARFAGPDATDEENNRLLLAKMRGVENRAARFVCVVALADAGKLLGMFRGIVEGRLLEKPRGQNGFGYDPLFFYPPFGCTLAEATAEQKLTVSHRGKAIAAMLQFLH